MTSILGAVILGLFPTLLPQHPFSSGNLGPDVLSHTHRDKHPVLPSPSQHHFFELDASKPADSPNPHCPSQGNLRYEERALKHRASFSPLFFFDFLFLIFFSFISPLIIIIFIIIIISAWYLPKALPGATLCTVLEKRGAFTRRAQLCLHTTQG